MFQWHPTLATAVATTGGALSVGLSAAMIPLSDRSFARIALRDLGQIGLVGLGLPTAWLLATGDPVSRYGLSLRHAPWFLAIDLALGSRCWRGS